MPTIQINALSPAGSDLFADSENYLTDLSEAELAIQGGLPIIIATSSWWCIGASIGFVASVWKATMEP